ncbi:MAG: hypothetical protein IJQ82_05510 [Selenomonadaceae bacterium]|nr:hypothetical protein [Selenomonadaceae bacterium]
MRTFAFIACCIFFTVLLTPITGPVGPLGAIWLTGKLLGASTPKGTSAGATPGKMLGDLLKKDFGDKK